MLKIILVFMNSLIFIIQIKFINFNNQITHQANLFIKFNKDFHFINYLLFKVLKFVKKFILLLYPTFIDLIKICYMLVHHIHYYPHQYFTNYQ
jgi:hypothetical protein